MSARGAAFAVEISCSHCRYRYGFRWLHSMWASSDQACRPATGCGFFPIAVGSQGEIVSNGKLHEQHALQQTSTSTRRRALTGMQRSRARRRYACMKGSAAPSRHACRLTVWHPQTQPQPQAAMCQPEDSLPTYIRPCTLENSRSCIIHAAISGTCRVGARLLGGVADSPAGTSGRCVEIETGCGMHLDPPLCGALIQAHDLAEPQAPVAVGVEQLKE